MGASVKIMLSYDYCHFEVCLSTDGDIPLKDVDGMRKYCQRLADKAVAQYKIAKNSIAFGERGSATRARLEREVKIIKENVPKSEWTPTQQATVKALENFQYYDYQDDWDDEQNQNY